jgi:hypothetical protein
VHPAAAPVGVEPKGSGMSMARRIAARERDAGVGREVAPRVGGDRDDCLSSVVGGLVRASRAGLDAVLHRRRLDDAGCKTVGALG